MDIVKELRIKQKSYSGEMEFLLGTAAKEIQLIRMENQKYLDAVEALRQRDGGAHDSDCKELRNPPRGCTCGHDLAVKALANIDK